MLLIIKYVGLVLGSSALAVFLAVLSHELGHLVLGRLTGYGCNGLACCKVAIVRIRGRWKLVAGKLVPFGRSWLYPKYEEARPGLTVLGGCLINLLAGGGLYLAAFSRAGLDDLTVFMVTCGFIFIYMGIYNLTEGSDVADGNTFKELIKYPKAAACYNAILSIEKHLMEGKPLKHLSEETFGPGEGTEGTLAAELLIYGYYAYLERHAGDNEIGGLAKSEQIKIMRNKLLSIERKKGAGFFAEETERERRLLGILEKALSKDLQVVTIRVGKEARAKEASYMETDNPRCLVYYAVQDIIGASDKLGAINRASSLCEKMAAKSLYPGLWRYTALEIMNFGLEYIGNGITEQADGYHNSHNYYDNLPGPMVDVSRTECFQPDCLQLDG